MNRKHTINPSCLLGMMMVLSLAAFEASAGTAVVIVNKDNPAATMNEAEVKSYFLKSRKTWPNGEKVRQIDQKSGVERNAFLNQVLKLSDQELVRHWVEKQYATAEPPPMQVDSDSAVLKFVGAFKGGIGVVNKTALEGTDTVKSVLEINF